MFETIELVTDDRGVATLTLNRPEKHNAMSGKMISELTQACAQLAQDDAVRVVVLCGAGRSFCAGGDLGWMRDQMNSGRAERAEAAYALARMLSAINTLPKPVIAKVHGSAFGGGVGLCCVSDIVFASEGAMFGLTETRLGLIPATIGPFVIARMGEGAARQVFMSSRRFDGARALALGIVSHVVADAALDGAVQDEVNAYLACAPGAIAQAKSFVLRFGQTGSEDVLASAVRDLIERWETGEAQSGIEAFFAKRPPPWSTA